MSSYSDDDYLRLLAKYNRAERQLAAVRGALEIACSALRNIWVMAKDDSPRRFDIYDRAIRGLKDQRAALANTDPAPKGGE